MSNNFKMPFNDDEYKIARNSSALQYAQAQGYELVKKGNGYYTLKEHDSMVFNDKGWWFWNSQGLKGKAIEFITQYEKKSFVDAVLALNGKSLGASNTEVATPTKNEIVNKKSEPVQKNERAFTLPKPYINNNRVCAYLTKTRKLDKGIVDLMIGKGLIYEEESHHNAVFVAKNIQGKEVRAFLRGTLTDRVFKGEVEGSDNRFPFFFKANNGFSDTLNIYEAPIDLLSDMSIEKIVYGNFCDEHRIALGGVSKGQEIDVVLEFFRDKNFNVIKNINICFDNDTAGQEAAKRLKDKYERQGYNCEIIKPREKDLNEDLIVGLKRNCYEKSIDYAKEHQEEIYLEDDKNNNRLCSLMIANEIENQESLVKDNKINSTKIIKSVSKEYGFKRVKTIIAFEIKENDGDNRIEEEIKNWAKKTLNSSKIEDIQEKFEKGHLNIPLGITTLLAKKIMNSEIIKDKEEALQEVKENGRNLKRCSKALQNDYDVVKAAISNWGLAIEYASYELSENKELALRAVRKNGLAYQYVGQTMLHDKEIIETAYSNNKNVRLLVPNNMQEYLNTLDDSLLDDSIEM